MSISVSMVSNAAVDLKPTMASNTTTPYNAAVSLEKSSLLIGFMDPNIVTASSRIEDNNYADPSNTST